MPVRDHPRPAGQGRAGLGRLRPGRRCPAQRDRHRPDDPLRRHLPGDAGDRLPVGRRGPGETSHRAVARDRRVCRDDRDGTGLGSRTRQFRGHFRREPGRRLLSARVC